MNVQKIKEWESRIEERKKNNESIREFCLRNAFTENQYYYWRKRIRLFYKKDNVLKEIEFASETKSTGVRLSFGNSIEVIPDKDFNEHEFLRIVALVRVL